MVASRLEKRNYLKARLVQAIKRSGSIESALIIGSDALGRPSELSDIDFLFFTSEAAWTRTSVSTWLKKEEFNPDAHFWNGLDKHHLLIDQVRVDLKILSHHRVSDILFWPILNFNPKTSVLKDRGHRVGAMIEKRKKQQTKPSYKGNSLDGVIVSLLSCAAQINRGETACIFRPIVNTHSDRM